MNDLQIFNSPEFGDIRAVELDGEPWFVGKDVATALGYSNPRDALARHVDEEDKNTVAFHDGTSGNPNQTIINESGVYSLIFSSKLPGAKKFKHWVTSEVLPSIRKTGTYLTPELAAALADLPAMMELLTGLEERLSALEGGAAAPQSPAGLLTAPEAPDCSPGPAARKRWIRTVSEKLNDLSVKFSFMPHNEILHRLYVMLEQQTGVSLDENRLQVMEEYGLPECSVLTGIFYNPDLREAIQRNIDYNLAPENRGW